MEGMDIWNHHISFATRKMLLWYAIVLAAGVVGVGAWYYFGRDQLYSDTLTGKVVSVSDNQVVIQGVFKDALPDQKQLVEVTFKVTDKTTYTHRAIVADNTQPAGQFYTPKTEESAGSFSDLKPGVMIDSVKADNNLNGKTEATALDIHYSIIVIPTPTPPARPQ